jgi:arginyl-tRNA synthetase
MRHFYDKVSGILEELVKKEYGVGLAHPLWELPQRQEFGDLSSMAALKLASKIKKDPLEIATQMKGSLDRLLADYIDTIDIIRPGFINIFLSKKILIDSVNEIITRKDDFFRGHLKKKILIEFLSANPTGPLSIAHGRQAVVGDAIANILEFFGNRISREYYLNDEGRQIELLTASVAARINDIQGKDFSFPKDGYRGEYIKDIARLYLESESDEVRDFTLRHIISLIKKDLTDLGIEFDNWFSQRRLIEEKKVEESMAVLDKRGFLYEQDGALWFASTKFGDDKDRVIRKADGELTYFASDIAYHKDKFDRGYDEAINLWGPDHHGYIKRVETALSALDYNQKELRIIIIQLVTLKTKERMSKRSGTMALLSDLIRDVGKDAARFYYLTRKNSSHLEFDIDLAKETSFDNPLYYIQYVCARIESIFRKAGVSSFDTAFTELLIRQEELSLIRTLLQFFYYLEKACYSLEPVFIIEFLKNLASSFHKFYENVRVIDEDKDLTLARLNLLQAVKIVFHCGLGLLGIRPVERM